MAESNKLIFFDVDGTLTDGNFDVPESAVLAIQKAMDNGHLCVINTGRPYTHIVPSVRAIPFDGFVCSCGMHVLLHGKDLLHVSFPPELCRETVEMHRKQNVMVIYESEEGMFFDRKTPWTPYMQKSYDRFGTFLPVDGDVESPDFFFDKFSAWYTTDTDLEEYTAFLREHFDPIDRGGDLFEVVAKGCSKRTGMDLIQEATGIPFEDTYAFGDSLNDLIMLEHVAHPIAMGSGMEEVKAVSEYVTTPLAEDGIADGLARYGLI